MKKIAVLVVWLAACSSSGGDDGPSDAAPPPPDAFVGPATALFQLPRGGVPTSDFYALPFPNDLRRLPDGTLDLAGHLRPNALLDEYLAVISSRFSGFSTNGAIFFRFSAPILAGSLPQSPEAFAADGAAVYLVDVDPASPDRGKKWPLRARFEHYAGEGIGTDWLSVLPYPGFPLRPLTTYACVVTSRVQATDGSPVARADDLSLVFSQAESDPAAAAARVVYQPFLDWLDTPGGDERLDVASVAVFTTQDPTSEMGRIREVIYRDVAPPTARNVKFKARYPMFDLWTAVYDSPNFQTGDPPYETDGGEIELDGSGDPVIQRLEPIRLAITFPVGMDMPATGWPTVIYAHGTGGSYLSFFHDGTAGRLAAEGLAVISFDQVLHGPRNPQGGSEEVAFFNFQNPIAGRDNVRQGALDGFTLVRLVPRLVIDPRHPGAKLQRFDGAKVYFMGHSQGGITGPPMLAYEPNVQGAVLSGAGGVLYLSFLNKTEPVDIRQLVAAIVRDEPLDEFNPFLALVQMFMDRSDSVNYGPLLVREPPPGVTAKDIFQSEGLIDHYTPPVSIEGLGTAIAGWPVTPVLQPVEGLALRGLTPVAPPVSGNVNGRTAVFLQYDAAGGSDGHFVVFDIEAAQRQHAQFLGTLARDGIATLVP